MLIFYIPIFQQKASLSNWWTTCWSSLNVALKLTLFVKLIMLWRIRSNPSKYHFTCIKHKFHKFNVFKTFWWPQVTTWFNTHVSIIQNIVNLSWFLITKVCKSCPAICTIMNVSYISIIPTTKLIIVTRTWKITLIPRYREKWL